MDQTTKEKYQYESGHQDRHKLLWQLYQMEQLNCVCNRLVKTVVTRSLMDVTPHRDIYLLPLEHIVMHGREERSTTDLSEEVHNCLEESEA